MSSSLLLTRRAILLSIAMVATAAATAGQAAGVAEEMLAQVNGQRARHRLPGLALDAKLSAAAQTYAGELMERGELSHVGRDGSRLRDRLSLAGFSYLVAAENLASGPPTARETVELWMQSEHHRRNILLPDVTLIGVGRAEHPNRLSLHGFDYFWTLLLARPA